MDILYEKVEASRENVFRYAMKLEDRKLSAQVDNLSNDRHIPGDQQKEVEQDLLEDLARSIKNTGFFELKEKYGGLPGHERNNTFLSVTIGRRHHMVEVADTQAPRQFHEATEILEEFCENELGLIAITMSPEELTRLANEAFLLGRDLYEQKDVKHDNLWNSIKHMKEAEWYLKTVEPKPEFYEPTVQLRNQAETELQESFESLRFRAERAVKLKNWREAADALQMICEKIPERSDEHHQYARKKLIDVQRRLDN